MTFLEQIRQLEERLFGEELNGGKRIMSERSFWHFRPSHHVKTGLLTAEDITLLSKPGKRLLSVGAHPAFLERLLPELGVPKENILLADKDPAIGVSAGSIASVVFDACETWPDIGTFDRIIFPESLCIALSDQSKSTENRNEKDAFDAALLASILRQAFERLRPGGILRANGPMSHPNVIRMVEKELQQQHLPASLESRRFFLSITPPPAAKL
ncbi:MAG: hypothetical protein WCS85_02355 [Candidatus Peribacteraceae bacterium]|jgi:hypothetical protein